MIQEYFRRIRIAIVFNTQYEHKNILDYFGIKRQAWTHQGACSFIRYKALCKQMITYTSHPLPIVYMMNGYTVISYYEFLSIISNEPINGMPVVSENENP
jgi:hypothetical protein